MKSFGLIVFFFLSSLTHFSSAQTTEKAEFSGLSKDKTYTRIHCYLPGEIYEHTLFKMMVELRPEDFPDGKPTVAREFYAFFSDSLLYLANDPAELDSNNHSGYLNEQSLTLFPAILPHLKTSDAMILKGLNNQFKMHQTDSKKPEVFDTNEEYLSDLEPPREIIQVEETETYDPYICDPAPTFPGGEIAMIEFIKDSLIYPTICFTEAITGNVYVGFNINADGSISDIQILRGVHKSLDEEAMRVISIMPAWNPGMINGNPVRSRYIVPVNFRIQ